MRTGLGRPGDGAAIAKLSAACLKEPWKEEDIEKAIADENGIVMYMFTTDEEDPQIAEDGRYDNTIPVSYAVIYFAGGEGELLSIATAEEFRRETKAWTLLRFAVGLLQEKEIKKLFLEVRAGNEGARAFYDVCGFEEAGLRKEFYRDPVEDAVLLRLDL